MRLGISGMLAACSLVPFTVLAGQWVQTTRVSVASGGGQANNYSWSPFPSANGRYVAFDSEADNLVSGDTNGFRDVFVHDRQTGITTRVSLANGGGQGNGWSYEATLSADGRYVAFLSGATNLVSGDTNGFPDLFVHDRQTRTTTRVNIATGGEQANGYSYYPVLSADGRFVAFSSHARNLVPGDTNLGSDVFVHDRQTGTTTRVSIASDGSEGNADSYYHSISADGRYLAFDSLATNLVPGDTNSSPDVFVRDRQTGTTTRVSVATGGGEANYTSGYPVLSANGRYVSFHSLASNLVPGDTNGSQDMFVHDREAGTTIRVSVATGGGEGNGDSFSAPVAAISADGRYVAFMSLATNLVPDDTNAAPGADTFVHDCQTGTTARVSVDNAGNQANGRSDNVTISADGRVVAFESQASNLVAGDTNERIDIFVRADGAFAPLPVPVDDFDGDTNTDPTVFRPSSGTWYELRSRTGAGYGVAWGIAGDTPVPGDYDGDGFTDPAVFRPSSGTWFVLQSTTGTGVGVQWGVSDDIPVPADYDGDGKIDVAVWRPSTGVWYIIRSTTNTALGISWGVSGDIPVPADFDGDGQADPTVFRPSSGTWYELRSTTGAGYGINWGQSGDVPLAGDYDGDGKADPTVFRASMGTWYELRSTTGAGYGLLWGTVNDIPIVGDYDGDGKMDPTVFRPSTSTWYQLRSTTSAGYGVTWGATGDLPQ